MTFWATALFVWFLPLASHSWNISRRNKKKRIISFLETDTNPSCIISFKASAISYILTDHQDRPTAQPTNQPATVHIYLLPIPWFVAQLPTFTTTLTIALVLIQLHLFPRILFRRRPFSRNTPSRSRIHLIAWIIDLRAWIITTMPILVRRRVIFDSTKVVVVVRISVKIIARKPTK